MVNFYVGIVLVRISFCIGILEMFISVELLSYESFIIMLMVVLLVFVLILILVLLIVVIMFLKNG